MPARNALLGWAGVIVLLLTGGPAAAARVRFHYAPADHGGTVLLQPGGPSGTPAERLTWLGGWEPFNCPPPRPTCLVTFRHPYTGQLVVVPLALPLDTTPRMEYRTNRVIYNYGSDTVEVHFLPDGRLDVIYNSGLFRAI
ncbi:MAG TPA: hypothetical protein VNK04_05490 [Gemmataceae bacterium]|nr:hypothetical protein [Gemmataceae bacterium]